MSLDNIQLPELVVRDLFKNSLVDLKTDNTAPAVNTGAVSYLGENSRKVTIIVSDTEALYLADDSLQFLLGIMTACKLSMADIALVNIHHYHDLDYTAVTEQLAAEKVLLFGVGPAQLKLPMQFPDYQVQQYNRQVYLAAPALTFLEKNKEDKKKLWTCLQAIFLN